MALAQAFRSAVEVGLESAWGTVATTFMTVRARPWSLRNNPTRAYPDGERVGVRDMDTNPSVPGRRWSQGDLPTFWYPDTGGLFLLAALGSESVAAAPVGATARKGHTISCADIPPSLTIHDFIGSVVSGTEKAYEKKGMSVDRFVMTWDATQDDALLDFTYSFLGQYGQRITLPTFSPSALLATPTWSAALTRNGSNNCRVQSMTLTFENNVARVKAGCGSRDDQDRQMGGRRVSGTMTILYDDETEYDLFEAGGQEAIVITFTDTNLLDTVSSTPYYGGLVLNMPKFAYTEYGREEVDGYWVQRIGFRAFFDSGISGPLRAIVYNTHAAYS